jgi:hypothetical protein
MISLDRLRANRRNAQKSTGPRTDRGKARSRQNALKHGLTGDGQVQPADEAAERERRMSRWGAELQPRTEFQDWVVSQVVTASLRLDRCRRLETAQRGVRMERAGCCWANDRRLAVEQLANRMSRNPGLIVSELSTSSQGCDWLIARWAALKSALTETGHWDDAQRSLAFDLFGVPLLERPFDHRITEKAPAEELLVLVREEIEFLEALKADGLDDLDSTERALAEADLEFDITPRACLLRRYEASSNRTLFWGLNLLRRCRREACEEAIDGLDDDLEYDVTLLSKPRPRAIVLKASLDQPAPVQAAPPTVPPPAPAAAVVSKPAPARRATGDLLKELGISENVNPAVKPNFECLLSPGSSSILPEISAVRRRQRRALNQKHKR